MRKYDITIYANNAAFEHTRTHAHNRAGVGEGGCGNAVATSIIRLLCYKTRHLGGCRRSVDPSLDIIYVPCIIV